MFLPLATPKEFLGERIQRARTIREMTESAGVVSFGLSGMRYTMAVVTGLLIFAAVIGSQVFLWWSCRRQRRVS